MALVAVTAIVLTGLGPGAWPPPSAASTTARAIPPNSFTAVNLTSFTVYGDQLFYTTYDSFEDDDGTLHRAALDGSAQAEASTVGGDSALSSDGTTLWLGAYNSLASFDLATQTTTPHPATPTISVCPRHLAATPTLIWFLDRCHDKRIGYFNPSDGSYFISTVATKWVPHALTADPAEPSRVLVGRPGHLLWLTAESDGSLTAGPALDQRNLDPTSMVWSEDGKRILTADGRVVRGSDLKVLRNLGADSPLITSAGPGTVAYFDYSKAMLMKDTESVAFKTMRWTGALNKAAAGFYSDGQLYLLVTDDDQSAYSVKTLDVRPSSPLSLSIPRGRYRYHDPLKITIKLGRDISNRDVTLTVSQETLPEATSTITVPKGAGSVVVTRRLTYNSVISVTSTGDATHDSVTRSATVKVLIKLGLTGVNPVKKSGKYQLFKVSQPAKLRAAVLPPYPGDCVRFPTLAWAHGQWNYVGGDVCVREDAQGHAVIALKGKGSIVGLPLKTQALWGTSEPHNRGVRSAWLYWKFVR